MTTPPERRVSDHGPSLHPGSDSSTEGSPTLILPPVCEGPPQQFAWSMNASMASTTGAPSPRPKSLMSLAMPPQLAMARPTDASGLHRAIRIETLPGLSPMAVGRLRR